MKKVTILALHLGYGGIENCISMLANNLSDKYEIEIISTYKLYEEPAFPLNSDIKVHYLLPKMKPNKQEFINAIKHIHLIKTYQEYRKARKILKLRKNKMIEAIQNCDSDIIISTRDIHNKWLGKYGKKETIKIGWEHNHPHGNQKDAKKIIKSVQNLDAFVVVSPDLKEFYEPKIECPCFYIPNAIEDIPKKISNRTEKRMISVGRLSHEKGYTDLIDVFDIVHQMNPDWHLDIIGDGVERNLIEQKIVRLHLDNAVTLHGFQDKDYINECLLNSSIYVMASLTESFGIVLLEAFSYGLPCIAFDSAEGANLLISNNWDGYLVSNRDKNQMAKRICELIQNQNRRIIMGDNGYKKAEKYQMKEIKKEWVSLLENDLL